MSKQLNATNESKLHFWVRNWECLQSVLPAPNHHVSVLVAEQNPSKTSSFTTVMPDTEVPFLDWDSWQDYEVDLSAYAGKAIYVAVRHTTNGASNVAFFDDFTFEHFAPTTSIQGVTGDITDNADVTVYSIDRAMVATGKGTPPLRSLAKGIYVVRIQSGNNTKTIRVTKK